MGKDSWCYLAHERLAIIDPASGDQPLYNGNKDIVVAVSICYDPALWIERCFELFDIVCLFVVVVVVVVVAAHSVV